MKGDRLDPKGLIREAYRIEGITASQCRAIFLDWALSHPAEPDMPALLNALLVLYQDSNPQHPMSEVLRQGLEKISAPKRRGGWRSRERR